MSFNFSDEYEKLLPKFWKKEKESMDPKDLGIQNVFTPIEKIEETTQIKFSDFVTSEMKDVAILFNVEFLQSLLKNINENYINNINFTFFYDSKWDLKQANEIARMYDKEVNFISIEKFSESKNVKDLVEAMGTKHFDIVFSNPPYSKNIDLSILKNIKKYSNKIIFIHPSSFILSNKERKTDVYSSLTNSNNLEKLILFWGNDIFQIGLFMPLCISVWNNNYNSSNVTVIDKAFSKDIYVINVNDISIYGNRTDIKHFIEKFHETHSNTFSNYTLKYMEQPGKYSIKFAVIRGNVSKIGFNDDFFTFLCQEENKMKKSNYIDDTYEWKNAEEKHGMLSEIWTFNSENERTNFVKYCKTKIARLFLSYIKFNGQLLCSCSYVPWLDFTQEWNDKKLCEEFNISKELWEYIDNFIPNYYDDYVSGF